MASYLQIENISKSYGPKVLFEHIAFNINEGDKIALVAPNGTGKTSLLRILAGQDKSDSGGKVLFLKDIRIAFLEQDYDYDPSLTVREQIERHSREHTGRMSPEFVEIFRQRVSELLTGFNLDDAPMSSLSGGEIKRVALSELLALDADFLIMDEPTNHLDVAAIEYLENCLRRSRCTLLMVTHDRYFLDRVCNTVMELDHGAVYTYRGDYSNYLEKRSERIANYNAETERVRNILRRELEWIHATPCARSGKARYRINAFHSLSERASQSYVTNRVSMEGVGGASRLGTKIIDCKNVSLVLDGKRLLDGFDYNFQRYEKVGVVGPNGVGKTAFVKLLAGELTATCGAVERGDSIKIGYYRQDGMEFKEDQTVLETVNDTRLLGRFLFPHDMLSTRVGRLSGGERRRLYLLTVLMSEPNLLILDEPTNDLDIVTLNILEEYLLEFKGTLIVVSHDRHFMDRICDHLLVFCGEGLVKDYVGPFSEYLASSPYAMKGTAGRTDAEQTAAEPSPRKQNDAPARPRRLTWKEQRELEALEAELPALEAEKKSLEEAMSAGTMEYGELQAASRRIEELMALIDEKETRWLELSVIIADLH